MSYYKAIMQQMEMKVSAWPPSVMVVDEEEEEKEVRVWQKMVNEEKMVKEKICPKDVNAEDVNSTSFSKQSRKR